MGFTVTWMTSESDDDGDEDIEESGGEAGAQPTQRRNKKMKIGIGFSKWESL
jgi:hypothetical protein